MNAFLLIFTGNQTNNISQFPSTITVKFRDHRFCSFPSTSRHRNSLALVQVVYRQFYNYQHNWLRTENVHLTADVKGTVSGHIVYAVKLNRLLAKQDAGHLLYDNSRPFNTPYFIQCQLKSLDAQSIIVTSSSNSEHFSQCQVHSLRCP